MLGPRFDVDHPILFHLGLKAARSPPCLVLRPIVGKHLLRRLILTGRHPIDFDGCGCRRAAEQVRPNNKTRVVIHESDQVGILSRKPEGEDVGLPKLIGRCPLKEPRPRHVPSGLGTGFIHQLRLVQVLANRLGAGSEQEYPPQNVRYPFDSPPGILTLQVEDLLHHRCRQLASPAAATPRRRRASQRLFPLFTIRLQPV